MNRREFLATGVAVTGAALLGRFAEPVFAATDNGGARSGAVRASVGADIPWTTYQAEEMKTTGKVMGPKYAPFLIETESSNQKYVKLAAASEYVEFTVK